MSAIQTNVNGRRRGTCADAGTVQGAENSGRDVCSLAVTNTSKSVCELYNDFQEGWILETNFDILKAFFIK